jgi:hypothetical protein
LLLFKQAGFIEQTITEKGDVSVNIQLSKTILINIFDQILQQYLGALRAFPS